MCHPLLSLFLLFGIAPTTLYAQKALTPAPELFAESAMAIDAMTGRVLLAKNIDQKRPVASTQKLLTALIIAEKGDLDSKITVEKTDGLIEPRNLWITSGSRYTRRKLLEMLLMRSFNDVTKCLARDHSSSQAAFVDVMNAKAAQLGMNHSHFLNAHGLTVEGQYSTARDMMKLARHAIANSDIRNMVATKESTFTYHGGKTIPIKNSNDLLHSYHECIGLKTGYTEASGRCLVCAAHRNGQVVLAVILGSTWDGVWTDSESVLRWGLDNLNRM
ncbi:MAG: D-alanyl-D-alanine carboxypeptidase [Verrucomicrobiales bacterium]|nr:D-alanyl-D-alanine carboxypeptidase [Verrucomicrobiales bacterium]